MGGAERHDVNAAFARLLHGVSDVVVAGSGDDVDDLEIGVPMLSQLEAFLVPVHEEGEAVPEVLREVGEITRGFFRSFVIDVVNPHGRCHFSPLCWHCDHYTIVGKKAKGVGDR